MELELLKQKIEMLMSCGVKPDHILRDMNVLFRAKEVIEGRLEFIKKCGIERVMPWMIKCDDQVLCRSIEIRNQRGTEQNKTLELLTGRLNWHGQTANSMFMKNKFLQKLDYDTTSQLLDELLRIFSPDDITANIGLLSHSVAHVKIRVAELTTLNKSHGISPQLLNMSDIKFKQFLKRVKNN
ncbi:transcription termination factor, mitochondrial-like [Sitodiplosis mosellana]|uniref:transcription termination factor, mitochondrial-like n=1 Tax=Sitodiplosis mosellana TaxID=263140 RepID=UPI002444174D|nr:transcription termination factor, mitochondrial-like [Sitodiplosis mosellana]